MKDIILNYIKEYDYIRIKFDYSTKEELTESYSFFRENILPLITTNFNSWYETTEDVFLTDINVHHGWLFLQKLDKIGEDIGLYKSICDEPQKDGIDMYYKDFYVKKSSDNIDKIIEKIKNAKNINR